MQDAVSPVGDRVIGHPAIGRTNTRTIEAIVCFIASISFALASMSCRAVFATLDAELGAAGPNLEDDAWAGGSS